MKKLTLFIFVLLVSTTILQAQRTVVVCGQIDNPVANQTVWVSFFSSPSGCTVQDTTVTDSLGRYSHTITIGAGCAYNGVRMNMLGCKGVYDTLWNTQYYDTLRSGPDTLKANFKYCDTCTFNTSFIDSAFGKTVNFYNTTQRTTHKFKWYFGDNNNSTSTLENPIFTYDSLNKAYWVCLVTKDTASGCKDSVCQLIATGNNNVPCITFSSGFTVFTNQDTARFTYSGSNSANRFKWYFRSGQTSANKNPTHIYSFSGTYNVCLVAEDTIDKCKDSICRSVTISQSPNCIGFRAGGIGTTGTCDSLTYSVTFNNNSSLNANKFSWTFGNSTTSSLKYPKTTYSNSGIYNVCLVAEDTIKKCKDSVCTTNVVPNWIRGTIFRNNNQKADSGRVWLIRVTVDSLTNDTLLTAIDSTVFNSSTNSTYYFQFFPSGDYLIKAALLPGAAFYSSRLPTYYDKETRWDKASRITINQPCAKTDIVLKSGNNPGGAGFIGGVVKQGANKVGDPLAKITIVLYNADGSPFGFTNTDINGYYEFTNIAYGDYTVIADVLGKPSEEIKVSISAIMPDIYNANFDVNTKNVTIGKDATGIVSIAKGKLKIYPNPANNNATVLFNANKTGVATITVMDLTGKTVLSQTTKTVAGNNEAELKINELLSGLYIITVNTDTTVYVGRIGINR